MRAQLNQNVKDGYWQVGDDNYRKVEMEIMNLEKQELDLRASTFELYKEMIAVPSQITAEKINVITDSYLALNAAMDAGVLASRSMQ